MHYILAYPEVLKAIIDTGRLPERTPPYLNLSALVCSENPEILVSMGRGVKKHGQIYLIKIKPIPAQEQQLEAESFIELDRIDVQSVEEILVHPEANQKLVSKLCSNKFAVKVFNGIFNPYHVFRFDDDGGLHHLMDDQSHLDFLRYAFLTAKKSLLITSYNLTDETFDYLVQTGVLLHALEKGVRIYFYINDKYDIPEHLKQFCDETKIKIDNMWTHSKIIAIDKACVSMGSFNWLSGVNQRYAGSDNGSVVFRDHCCEDLISSVWEHFRFYRHLQAGRGRQSQTFSQDRRNFHCVEFEDEESMVTYMPSPEAHQFYLGKAIERVDESIVICSPFINAQSLERNFPQRFLYQIANNNIALVFVVQEGQNTGALEAKLGQVRGLHASIVKEGRLHLKTIVMDDNEISCGSLNWLSAVRDRDHQSHNHEASLAVWGEDAEPLVKSFYESTLGRTVAIVLENLKRQINNGAGSPLLIESERPAQRRRLG